MITLRALEESDLDTLRSWRNQDTVRNFTREWRYLNQTDQENWWDSYCKSRKHTDSGQELMIICNNSKPIGIGGFVRIEWRNQKAEFSFYIGDDSQREEGVIREAHTLLMKKAFNEMNMNKVYWPI